MGQREKKQGEQLKACMMVRVEGLSSNVVLNVFKSGASKHFFIDWIGIVKKRRVKDKYKISVLVDQKNLVALSSKQLDVGLISIAADFCGIFFPRLPKLFEKLFFFFLISG